MAEQPTTLYRVFDCDLDLLYAGISHRALQRLKEHSKSKPDWQQSSIVLLDHYDSRDYALMMERETIQEDIPRWNVVHAASNHSADRRFNASHMDVMSRLFNVYSRKAA